MDKGSQRFLETSLVSLFADIANDANNLVRQEIALIKLEAQYELHKAKTAAITLGIGVGIVAVGALLLIHMLVHALAFFTVVPLWGCYGIVGSAVVVLGGIMFAIGKPKKEAKT